MDVPGMVPVVNIDSNTYLPTLRRCASSYDHCKGRDTIRLVDCAAKILKPLLDYYDRDVSMHTKTPCAQPLPTAQPDYSTL